MKRYHEDDRKGPQCCFISRKAPLTVFLKNMLAVKPGEIEAGSIPTQTYESVEAMVADGWMVD